MNKEQLHRCLRLLLGSANAPFLAANQCFLSGSAPIILELGEYRAAKGLSLACFGREGYRQVRETVSQESLGQIFLQPQTLALPVCTGRFGIRTFVLVESSPIRFELIKEDRFTMISSRSKADGVPVLSHDDLFVERLLANADQYNNTTVSAPIVDLTMMVGSWGTIPDAAWIRAQQAYGFSVVRAYVAAVTALCDAEKRTQYVRELSVEPSAGQLLSGILPKMLSGCESIG